METQKERLEAYVLSQPNYTVQRIYEDGGFSGEGLNRPGLKALLADVATGKVDCILSYKIDRLTRNPRDFYALIDLFEKHNVSFISVTQHFDTSSAMGRLMRNIMMDFAQFEREMTGERTRDKMQQRAEKGYWNGGSPPFGYRRVDQRLVQDPEQAAVVKLIFELFVDSNSLAKVRAELKLRGLKTRTGGAWGKPSIDHIIRNPVYQGNIRHKGSLYQGMHEPMIPEALFSKAQAVHRTDTHVTTRTKRTFLLRGLLKCSDCGSTMTPHYTKKEDEGWTAQLLLLSLLEDNAPYEGHLWRSSGGRRPNREGGHR